VLKEIQDISEHKVLKVKQDHQVLKVLKVY
jgi:hypothetical protein